MDTPTNNANAPQTGHKVSPWNFRTEQEGREATIYLYDMVGRKADPFWGEDPNNDTTGRKFIEELSKVEGDSDVINIRINSEGGYMYDGLAILNAIRRCPVRTVGWNDGIAYSAAANMLVACDEVRMPSTAVLMFHEAMSGVIGTASDMRSAADELDAMNETIVAILAERTGMEPQAVRAEFLDKGDRFITAQEALNFNIINKIETYKPEPVTEGTEEGIVNSVMNRLAKFFEPRIPALNIADPAARGHQPTNVNTSDMTTEQVKNMALALGLPETATEQEVLTESAAKADEVRAQNAANDNPVLKAINGIAARLEALEKRTEQEQPTPTQTPAETDAERAVNAAHRAVVGGANIMRADAMLNTNQGGNPFARKPQK